MSIFILTATLLLVLHCFIFIQVLFAFANLSLTVASEPVSRRFTEEELGPDALRLIVICAAVPVAQWIVVAMFWKLIWADFRTDLESALNVIFTDDYRYEADEH